MGHLTCVVLYYLLHKNFNEERQTYGKTGKIISFKRKQNDI